MHYLSYGAVNSFVTGQERKHLNNHYLMFYLTVLTEFHSVVNMKANRNI